MTHDIIPFFFIIGMLTGSAIFIAGMFTALWMLKWLQNND